MKKDIENEKDIELLVNTFYSNLQKESKELDALFNEVAKVDWETHLPKMYSFWKGLLFGESGFKGNPMRTHFELNEKQALKKENFDNWLALFYKTVDALFEGKTAEAAKSRAHAIAGVMQFKIIENK